MERRLRVGSPPHGLNTAASTLKTITSGESGRAMLAALTCGQEVSKRLQVGHMSIDLENRRPVDTNP